MAIEFPKFNIWTIKNSYDVNALAEDLGYHLETTIANAVGGPIAGAAVAAMSAADRHLNPWKYVQTEIRAYLDSFDPPYKVPVRVE